MTSILILSEQSDVSTDEVCLWLNYFGKKYLRINQEESLQFSFAFDISNDKVRPTLIVCGKEYRLDEFKTVWFRRGHFLSFDNQITPLSYFKNETDNRQIERTLSDYKYYEFDRIRAYFYQYLRDHAKCYNFPDKYNINKLLALDYAQSVGLQIPCSTICNTQIELDKFASKYNNSIITKSIADWHNQFLSEDIVSLGTLKYSDLSTIPDTFFYSMFQENLEKQFEIRTFIWDNKTYSAAIYHNNDIEAKVDFRNNYDAIRITPFNLPKSIESKLLHLMKKLDLESGSADFIVTPNNEYYFLEVNPVGQFDFVDKICNYNLAKIIANTLCND